MSLEWRNPIRRPAEADKSIRLDSVAGRFSEELKASPCDYVNLGAENVTMSAKIIFVAEDHYTSKGIPATEIPVGISDKVRDAVGITKKLANNGVYIDCFTFGALLSGGEVFPTPYKNYRNAEWRKIRFKAEFGTVEPTSDVDEQVLPSMQPLGIGRLKKDGSFVPNHAIVKLPDDDNQDASKYISKLGGREVVLTDLDGISTYYEATHIAPLHEIVASSGRREKPALRYSNKPKHEPGPLS